MMYDRFQMNPNGTKRVDLCSAGASTALEPSAISSGDIACRPDVRGYKGDFRQQSESESKLWAGTGQYKSSVPQLATDLHPRNLWKWVILESSAGYDIKSV